MSTALSGLATPDREVSLYEADEHEWIAAQIAALRSGRLDLLDRVHLEEYLTDMTIRDRRELKSRLTVLLIHLLKLRVQPARLTNSWVKTILEQQREILSIIEEIPSLGRQADAVMKAAYPAALHSAVRETGLPASRFPGDLPWSLTEALVFEPPEPPPRRR
jgi:hypothetical protein